MTLRALVTRPEEDAAPLAAALAERGIDVTAEPLLSIRPIPDAAVDLAGVQALLFTSANGVRAFTGLSAARDLPAFCVGDATAAAAREAGFAQVESAAGDVAALARLVAARLDPTAGALFHAAGSAVAGDLAGVLGQAGFTLRREMLYEAKPAAQLSPTTVAKLANGELDLVLLFSPRTAATFASLARAAGEGVVNGCAKAIALCLSPAVAAAAGELSWRELRTAVRPELPALLDLIDAELAARARGGDAADPQDQPAMATAAAPQFDSLPPKPAKRSRLAAIAAVAAVVSLIAAAAVELSRPLWFSDFWGGPVTDPVTAERMAAMDRRLAAVENDVTELEGQTGDLQADLADMRNRVTALESAPPPAVPEAAALADRLEAIEKEVAVLRAEGQHVSARSPAVEVAALTDRIAALESKLAQMPASTGAEPATVDAAAMEKLAAENAALHDQVAALAAQLDSLKGVSQRLDALDQAVAARSGDGGATLVLAVSNLGAALSTARPFAAELGAVTQIAASDAALAAQVKEMTAPITTHAAAGIPTLVDLRNRFAVTARAIVDAAQHPEPTPAQPETKDWWGRQLDWLSSAADYVLSDVTVRPVGDVPGDAPGARVARAEVRLGEGALAAAITELEGLTGPPAEVAAPWLADARARIAVEQAMARLQAAVVARVGSNATTSNGAGG